MKTPYRKNIVSVAVAAVSAAWLAPAAVAQDEEKLQLEEVIVTAERREATLQDTPIAISAFASEALETYGVTDLSDLEGIAPSLSITPFPNSKSSLVLFIRGVGNNDVQTSQDPAVGVYMDGVYLGRAAGLTGDVADLERVEVLRGPQGTLYGRNTTGGAVNMISAKPGDNFKMSEKLTTGNLGIWSSTTTVETGEVVEGLRAKFTGMVGGKDGRVENLNPQGEDYFGAEDKMALRFSVSYQLNEDISFDYSYDRSELEGPQEFYQVLRVADGAMGALAFNLNTAGFGFDPNTHTFATAMLDTSTELGFWTDQFFNAPGVGVNAYYGGIASEDPLEEGFWSRQLEDSETHVYGNSFTVNWQLSDNLVFKSITGIRGVDEEIIQDYSGSPSPFFLVDVDVDQEQFSQEFQFIGDLGDKIKYVAGLYYFNEESLEIEYDRAPVTIPDFNPANDIVPGVIRNIINLGVLPIEYRTIESENSSLAVYGQLTYSVTDKLDITGGLRWTADEREAEKSSINFTWPALPVVPTPVGIPAGVQSGEKTFVNWSPTLTLDYQVNETLSTYGKIVTGYKSGGFNVRSTQAGFQPPFEEEKMISFEAGVKSSLADNRVRLNAALFNSQYDDMQVQQITNPSQIFLTDVFNAGEATISGLELDVTALLTEGLTLDFAYAYVDADFDEVIDGTTGADVTDFYVMPYAPETAYNLTLNYFREIGFANLVAMINYNWRDDQYGTADSRNDLKGFELEAYGLLNGRIGLADIKAGNHVSMDVGLWGKNLADEEYLVHSISQGTIHSGYFGEQRTFGLDLKVTFE